MNIINPIFKIQDSDNNIFTWRKKEYENILTTCREILEPVREIGFEIIEFSLKDSKFSSKELSKTFKQNLAIRIQKGTSIIDLSIIIPKLIDNNYIFINGRKKIPLFQLFDIPIVTRGENIKLRTNVATLMIVKEKEEPFISVTFLGRKVPLSLLMLAYYGIEFLKDKYNIDKKNNNIDQENLMDLLLNDLNLFYTESPGYTQDDFVLELGKMYSKYNAKSKGEDILFA